MNVNFKSSPSESTDPYFNNVSLLLNMDGLEGSTNFIDSSQNNFTMSASGNAQISTTIKKFGSGAGYFNGDSYIVGPNDPSLSFGTGNFTIESWIYITGSNNEVNTIISRHDYGEMPNWLLQILNKNIRFIIKNDLYLLSNQEIPLNTWSHIAVTRELGEVKLFINGLMDNTASNNTLIPSDVRLTIGGDNTGYPESYFYGYLDDIRITSGIARYTGNFTPPTEISITPPKKSLRFGKSNDGKKTLLRPVNLPSTSLPPSYTSLVSFGSNDGVIDENNSTFTPIQNADNLFINGPKEPNDIFVLFFNNTFDWSNINSLGLRLSIDGSNPGTELYIETLNTIYAITRTYNTITIGVNNTSSVIPLTLDLNNNNLSDTVGLIITFIGNLPSGTNITLYDIVSINS